MKTTRQTFKLRAQILASTSLLLGVTACSSLKSFFGANSEEDKRKPISNPFGDYYTTPKADPNQRVTLRSKKGERSVEVELPGTTAEMTDFVIPVNPAFKDGGRGRSIASVGSADSGPTFENNSPNQPPESLTDDRYAEKPQSQTDREILATLPGLKGPEESQRREIETGLGLVPAEDNEPPQGTKSYLAMLDRVKQLYKGGRYEAALLEVDDNIRLYQTDPRLHQMRGTLLDRLGKTDLAIRSWNQALRFDPGNGPLRRFVERKQQQRSIAGK